MLALVYIFIAIITIVGIWQMTNIFNMKDVIASKNSNNVQGKLFLGFLIVFYIFMLYNFITYSAVLLPESASVEGKETDALYFLTMAVIIFVQFVVQFLLFYFSYKYRGVEGQKAIHFADSHKLELIWTVTPAVVLAGIIIYGMVTWSDVMYPNEEDALFVEVYAQQFKWEARYAGQDNQLGRANVRNIKGINTMGVDMTDKNAQDDIPTDVLYLPKGKRVIFKFRSQDVLHSAYMPHFRAQMNCVPGMVTQFSFTPSITTEEFRENPKLVEKLQKINKIRKSKRDYIEEFNVGQDIHYDFDFFLLCNKICGASHYNMQMKIVVVEEDEFNSWLKKKETIAQLVNK